jgi:hypothetical protein
MELEWVSRRVQFSFTRYRKTCTKEKTVLPGTNQTAILQRNFHGVAKKHVHIEPTCKLQVTPRSRGLYQNKGHMWGGRSECGLGPTGRAASGPTPTKTVAPGAVLTRPILIFFNPAWGLICCNCGLGMMCIGNEKQPTLPIENCKIRSGLMSSPSSSVHLVLGVITWPPDTVRNNVPRFLSRVRK